MDINVHIPIQGGDRLHCRQCSTHATFHEVAPPPLCAFPNYGGDILYCRQYRKISAYLERNNQASTRSEISYEVKQLRISHIGNVQSFILRDIGQINEQSSFEKVVETLCIRQVDWDTPPFALLAS